MILSFAKPDDAANLAAIHQQAFEVSWSEAAIHPLLCSGVVIAPFKPSSGFMLLQTVGDEAEILTLAVVPEVRREGLATALVLEGLRAAAIKGARRCFLEVDAENFGAAELYRRLGFNQQGRRKNYYHHADGTVSDALILASGLDHGEPRA